MKNKVVLLGYMGVGKTTIAKLLAKKLQFKHLDLDDLIEKEEGFSVQKIFDSKGELYFRKIEHQIFKKLIENHSDKFVLSTGGGTLCYANNHLFLKNPSVTSIYLKGTLELLINRLYDSKLNRPLLAQLDKDELANFVAKHTFERSFFYHQANFTVSVDDKSLSKIVLEIEKLL